ncbi:MAG TPA: hypothetical protein VNN19_10925 [bacterium]|nr:hypothetical protein [bacterium]
MGVERRPPAARALDRRRQPDGRRRRERPGRQIVHRLTADALFGCDRPGGVSAAGVSVTF